jgi:hypothetical protein
MKRAEYYAGRWDGVCCRCRGDYFANRGNSTCLACNAQRQDEISQGLWFDEDGPQDETNSEWISAQEFLPA